MPIYEYRCSACGEQVEKITSKQLDEIECPKCSKPAKRVVSVFASANSSSSGGCSAPAGSGFG